MARIDQETVNKILDAVDIVDVVSDFVKLKRRGVNYVGLCPFHNERTPSFSVSKAKGLCKCFSCGKGGSAVGFIMELEQLSYVEALKYLARKYNIEVKEREMTDAEREAATERESMLAVNAFALDYFEKNLLDDPDGRAIGLSYFMERGINEAAIKRFRLGYSLDRRDALLLAAKNAGYNEKYLVDTGLCIRNDRGQVYDRFKGRVMYPVFSVSGKVVAFGGRTLRSDKEVAKYVNSPESIIYSKSNELYGLYQAKQSIVRKNKCLLVEGYMDVISMSQSGIENVVASSGTSLTEGQIRLIHRFTENVTVIYDSDPAGIKASLRGIDMLLAEGMKIKVLLLPDGDDPDSFAQSHSLAEIEEYMQRNETDFIRFKTHILLDGAENDPLKRASVITDIVKSIACIPDVISRAVYIGECSRLLQIEEKILKLEVDKQVAIRLEAQGKPAGERRVAPAPVAPEVSVTPPSVSSGTQAPRGGIGAPDRLLAECERSLVRYVVKYGTCVICDTTDDSGAIVPLQLLEYVEDELSRDNMQLICGEYKDTYNAAVDLFHNSWPRDFEIFVAQAAERRLAMWRSGVDEIGSTARDLAEIKQREQALKDRCDEAYQAEIDRFRQDYIVTRLSSSPVDEIRRVATDLGSERYHLSKVHSRYKRVDDESDRLQEVVPKAIVGLKDAHLNRSLREIKMKLAALGKDDPDSDRRQQELLRDIDYFTRLRMELARDLGERVIIPRR